MSMDDPQSPELLERAFDAHAADEQRALAAWIASRPADQHAHWEQLLAETQATREALSDVLMPPTLAAQLMLIARPPLPWHWQDVLNYRLRPWQLAASLAVIAMVVTYSVWPEQLPRLPTLGRGAVQQIAQFGVGHRSTPLQIISDDPDKVLALFQSRPLAFTARLPRPAASLTLVGGAITPLANSPAAMTRWHGPQGDFTVYQFDAAALQLPAGFATVQQQLGAEHVLIWPGDGPSAWALVSEGDADINPFCGAD